MRHVLKGLMVAALGLVAPCLAWAGNQEVADQIARNLRDSGQLTNYKIGVKFQDGTAWLKGRVTDDQQMKVALELTMMTPEVERVVNELTVGTPELVQFTSPSAGPQLVEPAPQPTAPYARVYPAQQAQAASAAAAAPKHQATAAQRLQAVISGAFGSSAPQQEQPSNLVPAAYEAVPVEVVTGAQPQPLPAYGYPRPISAAPMGQPLPIAYAQNGAPPAQMVQGMPAAPMPMYNPGMGGNVAPAQYDQPYLPNYSWPSYAAYPNYAALTYPKQYSPTAWPYIGPFYPYPQVPLGWRRVTLEWDDGWWSLDFKDMPRCTDTPLSSWR
jgi:hypothetical protein